MELVVIFAVLTSVALDTTQPARGAAGIELAQRARTCKQVSSCEEAVERWCSGYRRADADNDGIPCENVCRSKEQVDEIRADIGC